MSANLEQNLIERFRALPLEKQREALSYVEELLVKTDSERELPPHRLTLWDSVRDLVESVPPEERSEVPTDGSLNVDHYLYGAPKRK